MESQPRIRHRLATVLYERLTQLWWRRMEQAHANTATLADLVARFSRLNRMFDVCRNRQWAGASQRVVRQLQSTAQSVLFEFNAIVPRLDSLSSLSVPTLRQLHDEIDQLDDEFDRWAYHPKTLALSVTTDPIELEGVYLGPFDIRLNLGDLPELYRRSPYEVVALQPNTPPGSSHVTHPHVADDHVCEGDATNPIRAALEAGRLTDFFQIVTSLLNTYNSESPYVSIEDWDSESCADCSCSVSESDRRYCDRCDSVLCYDCTTCCQRCDHYYCADCISRCPACDEPVCSDCLPKCDACGRPCCTRCTDEDLCPPCRAKDEEQHEREQTIVTAEPGGDAEAA